MYVIVYILALTFFHFQNVSGANILVIHPAPSYSHQIQFQPLWRALDARGHNITLVTCNPMRDPNLKNIKEIDISYGYEYTELYKVVELASNDSVGLLEVGRSVIRATSATNEQFFKSPEGQNLLNNKDNQFDLLIVEGLLIDMMAFSWKYQIPYISVSSLDCSIQFHDSLGNLNHPIINPDPNLYIEDQYNMSFFERLQCFFAMVVYKDVIYNTLYIYQHKFLAKYFGEDLPPLIEIQNNMSLAFIATNPIFHNIRALMPNTITIGNGMHISPPKPLPNDIEAFFTRTKQDIIYFSLGSNIKGHLLNDTTKLELIKAFANVPYKILWKIDQNFTNLPENVMIKKWLPQQDILRHPKVKAFITQGGLQSMQESIYFKKPMIGIPCFGDQHMNVKRMVSLGYGVKVHKHNITQASIVEAINEIMSNPKYREKAEEYGEIFKDTDMPNVDKVVWWTEFVIRHKGAPFFKNPAIGMPRWKYWMLDVVGIVFIALFCILFALYSIVKLILGCILTSNKKSNQNKNKKNN